MTTSTPATEPPRIFAAAAPAISKVADALVVAAIIIALLYLGSSVFQPLAIAALLAFVLTPIILRLRRSGMNRTGAVLLTVFSAMTILGGLGWLMTSQIADLATDLPRYEYNLRQKVRDIRGLSASSSALERASDTLKDLQSEISGQNKSLSPGATQPALVQPPAAEPSEKPIPVEIRPGTTPPLDGLTSLISPLITPLATTGLVLLFLIFILLEREDIRDRILRLAGTTDLQRSTAAMNEAAARLGRFFLVQTALNAGFGVVIGVGLAFIGVPNAILWGILGGLMRFVPFIGSFIAAAFPIALAAAVDPGWSMVIATALLFIICEPIAGHVIEPVVYGRNTGLSPLAVVAATMFWTLLWGPVGLLLATPLTLCLVVLGRYVEGLAFVDVILGDRPALEPDQRLYQRLLSGDADEGADQAEQALRSMSAIAYLDNVALRAIAHAQTDAAAGRLKSETELRIVEVTEEIIDDVSDSPGQAEGADGDDSQAAPPELVDDEDLIKTRIACVAARTPLDHAANLLVADAMRRRGFAVTAVPFAGSRADVLQIDANPEAIVISCFATGATPARVRFHIRRLRRFAPDAKIIVALWLASDAFVDLDLWQRESRADLVVQSISELREHLVRLVATPRASPGVNAADPPPELSIAEASSVHAPGPSEATRLAG